ncbi:MAG: NADPH-dependent F420 reductase [Halodesulfurarchaeum sp.]
MRVAILGGTGDIGQGLALRFGFDTHHEVVIGSRDPERARTKADEYETELGSRGVDRKITGFVNEMAADRGDVVILAVPPEDVVDVVETVSARVSDDAVLVTPVVRMRRLDGGFGYDPPEAGSMAALIDDAVPEAISLVGAFHTLAADRLANLDLTFDLDTLVFGDDQDAKERISTLASDIEGLRPLDAGPLSVAPAVESLTPLVITLGMHGGGHDLGVKFQ